MASVVNHGITDMDYDGFLEVVNKSEQVRSSVYERKEYMEARQDAGQKTVTENCAEWYKHSSYAIRIKNKDLNQFLPNSFFEKFKMRKNSADITVYRFTPGQFTPPHMDMMGEYRKMSDNEAEKQDIVRVWIALSEPELGHALFVGKDQVVYNVPRGTTLQFNFQGEWHSGVNAGIKDRYFLTVTGVKNNG